jgi:hypothetical protein
MNPEFPKGIEFIAELSINFSTKGLYQVICLLEYAVYSYDYTPKNMKILQIFCVNVLKLKTN